MASAPSRRDLEIVAPPIEFDAAGIPDELLFLDRWLVWKLERRGAKWTKRPVDAKVNDPRSWLGFDKTRARALAENYGIGFVLGDGLVGLDFDHVVDDDGELHPAVVKAVLELKSYAEFSPSGRGVHILVRGAIERARKLAATDVLPAREIYDDGRFFTMTGRRLPIAPDTIAAGVEAQLELDRIVASIFTEPLPIDQASVPDLAPTALSDDEILHLLSKARNRTKFSRLFRGDTTGYASHSEADLALTRMMRFYTRDAAQLDRLFRQSCLKRDKWDELRGEMTYGEETIRQALAGVGRVYVPRQIYEGDADAKRLSRERTSYGRLPLWWVVRLHGIGELALRILIVLASYDNGEGDAWPSIETIAAHCRVTQGRVKEALAILSQAGVFTARRRWHDTNRYSLIYDAPEVLDSSTSYAQLRARSKKHKGTGIQVAWGTGIQDKSTTNEDNHNIDTGSPARELSKIVKAPSPTAKAQPL